VGISERSYTVGEKVRMPVVRVILLVVLVVPALTHGIDAVGQASKMTPADDTGDSLSARVDTVQTQASEPADSASASEDSSGAIVDSLVAPPSAPSDLTGSAGTMPTPGQGTLGRAGERVGSPVQFRFELGVFGGAHQLAGLSGSMGRLLNGQQDLADNELVVDDPSIESAGWFYGLTALCGDRVGVGVTRFCHERGRLKRAVITDVRMHPLRKKYAPWLSVGYARWELRGNEALNVEVAHDVVLNEVTWEACAEGVCLGASFETPGERAHGAAVAVRYLSRPRITIDMPYGQSAPESEEGHSTLDVNTLLATVSYRFAF